MEKHNLSILNYLKGLFVEIYDQFDNQEPENILPETYAGYRLEKSLTSLADQQKGYQIGLYSLGTKRVVIKFLKFKNKNLKYEQLLHEANLLKLLNTNKSLKVRIPRLLDLKLNSNMVVLIREYINGTPVKKISLPKKLEILNKCLEFFRKETVSDNNNYLSRRPEILNFLQMPFFLIFSIFKKPADFFIFIKIYIIYVESYFMTRKHESHLVIAHRDLHSENILISGNYINIVDNEIAILAKKETDLAIISRYYISEIPQDILTGFILNHLSTRIDKHNFLQLTIFYTFQKLALLPVSHKFYLDAQKYTGFLINNFLPFLLKSNRKLNILNYAI